MGSVFDENDLKTLFSPPPKPEGEILFEPEKKEPINPEKEYQPQGFTFITAAKLIALFISIFLLSYFLINFQAILDKTHYFYDVSITRKDYSKSVPTPTADPFNPNSEAKLIISKIGVDAPINWSVKEDQLQDKLLEGLVHSEGTALPGQIGNIFITGHSSYYSWVSSLYKDVFALLNKVDKGDKIFIKYSSRLFEYEVIDIKVVSPSDVSVMDQTDGYNLTLMTCVPVGTNLNRLIVVATQVNQSSESSSP